MATIPVGNTHALVDDEDYDLVAPYTWHLCDGYAATEIAGETVFMHDMIMERMLGRPLRRG